MTPHDVSLAQAARQADKLDGKLVRVSGYIYLGPEEENLWRRPLDHARRNPPPGTCLAVKLTSIDPQVRKALNQHRVTIVGQFRKDLCGPGVCLGWCTPGGVDVQTMRAQ